MWRNIMRACPPKADGTFLSREKYREFFLIGEKMDSNAFLNVLLA